MKGQRVPCMAELDVNVGPGDRQALIIRPLIRLDAEARYIVALVGLKDAAGRPLLARGFAALRDHGALNKSLQPLQARYEGAIFPTLTRAGVSRAALTLAWDVQTARDASSRLVAMRDTAYAMSATLGYTITSAMDTPSDAHLLREVLATVQAPMYLANDSSESSLSFGSDGRPSVRTLADVPVTVHIPRCAAAATAPLPIVVFGHGIFGTALETLRMAELEQYADQFCAVFVATDWIGLAKSDEGTVANVLATDLNQLTVITDRLQQAHVNTQTMTHLFLTKMLSDPALSLNGQPVSDGKQVYYLGVSLGGIQGGTFMGLTPEITRGVLNVPGAEWSLLIFRSVVFALLKPILLTALPDPLDEQIAIATTQGEWDYTDPITFAPHLTGLREPPLPAPPSTGMTQLPAKQVLMQESEGDALVTNLSTRLLARTIGLGGFDFTVPVYGIPGIAAPAPSAYTQWNSHPIPLPPDADTALGMDNGAHTAVVGDARAQQQMKAFLRMGLAESVCAGPCNIE
jgi:hypothetical protein